MKKKVYAIGLKTAIVMVMAVFLSTMILVTADSSFAASGKKKSQNITRTSAVEYTEAQIKQLQGALSITAAQEPLWNDLTQVMRENAKDMDDLNKERAENTEPMNAVEHMKFHSKITQAHLDQMNKLLPPFEAFYDSLSDDQKKIADTTFRTGKYGKHKRNKR